MKNELQEKLYKDFPLIFKQKDLNIKQSCMAWGIECGPGWEPLIRCLCEHLMWDPKAGKKRENPPVAAQVKEKFGTLRFYVDGGDDKDQDIIWFAEHLSGSICETCGSMGQDVHQTQGWVRTICNSCDDKRENDWVKELNENDF